MKSNDMNDTIAAPATAAGKGGVGIIRISGPETKLIAKKILGLIPKPRFAHYANFKDIHNVIIDNGIALFFENPNSFTGEDVLELHGHGGPMVMDCLLQNILKLGARLAKPGEFSERAFLNNKIDLIQAEAIADLINASSEQAVRSAQLSLQGIFSEKINEMNQALIHLRILVEACIDFPDEEIDFLKEHQVFENLQTIIQKLIHIQATAKQGALLQQGIKVVIAGKPNVGKSSLLNALSGRDSAIVTPIAGTTRDVLREHIHIDGLPLHIIDTAGLHASDDMVEQEGMRRAEKEIQTADVVLWMTDDSCHASADYKSEEAFNGHVSESWKAEEELNCHASESWHPENIKMSKLLDSSLRWHDNIKVIIIKNKIDLHHQNPIIEKNNNQTTIYLSAKTGAGIDLLKNHLKELMGYATAEQNIFIARRRHLDALARGLQFLFNAEQQMKNDYAIELLAEDLRQAQLCLNEMTGEFTSDDLLGKIFSEFCIGK